MAKSSLNLLGAKRQKVELDYLRLVYACRLFPESRAYLVVTDAAMEETAESWAKKYQAEGIVKVKVLPLDQLTTEFRNEKARNLLGMVELLAGNGAKSDAVAAIGETICEEYLLEVIKKVCTELIVENVHSIRRKLPRQELPLQVNWDFYAAYDGPVSELPPGE